MLPIDLRAVMVLESQPSLSRQPKLGREGLMLAAQFGLSLLDIDLGRKNYSPTVACAICAANGSLPKLGRYGRGHLAHGRLGRQSAELSPWQELRMTCRFPGAIRRQPTTKKLGAHP